jgi:diguanylate cyclase (GGDEF)-like protein
MRNDSVSMLPAVRISSLSGLLVMHNIRQWPKLLVCSVTAALMILSINLAVILFIRDETQRIFLIDITYPLWFLLAALGLWLAAICSARTSYRLAAPWGILAVAALFSCAGDVIWAIYELGAGFVPYPSIADLFYLAAYPLYLCGVLLLPTERFTRSEWIRTSLDMVIVMVAASCASWYYLIGPTAAAVREESLLVQLVSLAAPVAGLVLLWAMLVLLYRQRTVAKSGPLLLLSLAFGVDIVGEIIYSHQALIGLYNSAGLLDMSWILMGLLLAIAGVWQATQPQPAARQTRKREGAKEQLDAWLAYLPYLLVILLYGMLESNQLAERLDDLTWLSWGVGLLISLVLVRQAITLHENHQQAATVRQANQALAAEIEERKRGMAALRRSEARQTALLSAIPDLVFRVNRAGLILDCTGPSSGSTMIADQWIGTDIRGHTILGQNTAELLALIEQALTNEKMQTQEFAIETPKGMGSFEARIVGSGPDEVVAIVRDVTERKQAEERMAHDAVHDALTGLPNRVLYMERLRHAIEFARRHEEYHFSVLYLDVDRFKVINDSLGHPTGDQLLIALAQRLRMCVRTGDTVARLGGDEFVILLEDMDDENAGVTTAQCIHSALEQPFHLNGHQYYATVSIGILTNAERYDQPEDVLRDADIALYQAKLNGKARFALYDNHMGEQAQNRLALENDLRFVLERNELELHYQPILTLQSDRIVGFEALLRWRHPHRGLVAPNEFIPIAEETGLIIPIGQWVLTEACRQLRQWQIDFPQMPPLTMSVNISAVQFTAPDFVDQIKQMLQTVGLDPTSLRLELTESVWLNSTTEPIALFRQLSDMGIQLHIDDFGTGYSSLAYLHYFPIRMLKIDRAFLDKMDQEGGSKDLVRTVIAMAHDLGMEAVAEGIETVEQLENLKQFGCDYGQGYLLSRPSNRMGIEALLRSLTTPLPLQLLTKSGLGYTNGKQAVALVAA